MQKMLIRFLAVVLGLLIAARFVEGIEVADPYTAVIVAVVLGVLNLVVRPILVLLTLPVTIITLGTFLFVLNAGIFWFVSTFIEGFGVTGFVPAVLGSLVVSIASWVGNKIT
jgi:putative membrane protein